MFRTITSLFTKKLRKKSLYLPYLVLIITAILFLAGCPDPSGTSPPEDPAEPTIEPTAGPSAPPPVAPDVSGPVLSANVRPTWTWDNVTDAANYRYSFTDGSGWIETTELSYTPDSDFEDGFYTLYVQAGNPAGWSDSGSWTIEVNTNLPLPPTITGITSYSYNTPQSFTITDIIANATAYYSLNNGTDWIEYTAEVTITDEGEYQVVARQIDEYSRISPPTFPSIDITIDISAPNPPTGLDLDAADDTGSSDTDNITNQTSNLTISGSSEADAAIDLASNIDGELGSTTADGSGFWSINVSLTEAVHSITATATDTALNTSGDSTALVINVDTLPGSIPAGLDLAAADDTGNSTTDNITNHTSLLTISGTSDANILVSLFSSVTGALGSTNTDGSGNWTIDVSLSQAVHSITALSTDIAGNESGSSTALVITVDTTGNAPTSLDLAAADDTGSSTTDNITNKTTNLTISGTSEVNATVNLSSNVDGALASTSANGSGYWSADTSLTPGVHNVTATMTDIAGNTSGASTALVITIDTSAPGTPAGLDLAAADDSGVSDSDNITSQTSSLTISGSSEANALVTLSSSITGLLGSGSANGSGSWLVNVSLNENVHTVTATATDLAGNTSGNSTGLVITIDTTPPGTPSVPDLAAADDSGSSNTDNITRTITGLTFTGTGDANVDMTLMSDLDGELASATADGSGNWTFDPIAIPVSVNDTHSITAQATDTAGNTASSSGLSLVVDTTAPAVRSALSPATKVIAIDATIASNFTDESDVTPVWNGETKELTLTDLAGNSTLMTQKVYQGPNNNGLQTAVEIDTTTDGEVIHLCAGDFVMNDRLRPSHSMTIRGEGSAATSLTQTANWRRTIDINVTGLTIYIEYLKMDNNYNRQRIYAGTTTTLYLRDIHKGTSIGTNLVEIDAGAAYYWNGTGYTQASNGVDGWIIGGGVITFTGDTDTRYWY
ncbi:MAG: hypothetical protein JXB88_21365 [Spirochaetales bacterium]|nr:hypothetical protein [Spirochaetales bacterium]